MARLDAQKELVKLYHHIIPILELLILFLFLLGEREKSLWSPIFLLCHLDPPNPFRLRWATLSLSLSPSHRSSSLSTRASCYCCALMVSLFLYIFPPMSAFRSQFTHIAH